MVDNLSEYIPENYDAYIFTCRSGEFFLIMHHLRELLASYQSKQVIILTTMSYHINIFSLFDTDLEIKQIPWKFVRLNRHIGENVFKLKSNKRVIIPITFDYYLNHEDKIHSKTNLHFYHELLKVTNLSNHNLIYPRYNNEIIDMVNQAMINMNLSRKFIILSMDTQSNDSINAKFWLALINELKTLDYDIYFNSLTNNHITRHGKTCYMLHSEVCYLSSLAEAVIGVRSGLMDILAPFAKKLVCIYTDFKERRSFKRIEAKYIREAYSLHNIPNANNIYEVLVYEKDIITSILRILKNENISKS